MQPKISVIFPVGNREAWLREALESVLAQSFGDFEILVIEDGLPQPVESIIRSYRDERIRRISFPINMGISTARNAGLLMARAPCIALMDSDDVALPNRFALQYAWMEAHPDVTVCASNAIKMFSDGKRVGMRYPETDGIIKSRLLLVDSSMLNPTAMFRTEFVRKYRLYYDANLPRDNDHRFYVEMMRKGAKFYGLQEELLLYRRHEGNATNSRLGVDEEKSAVRELLLPLFFPELSGEENRIMLKGLCEDVHMTMIEACFCIVVMNKALRETRTAMGEDRAELRRILQHYRERLIRSLNKATPLGAVVQ